MCSISLLLQWLRSPSGICHLLSRGMCLLVLSYGWRDGHLHTAISLLALCLCHAVPRRASGQVFCRWEPYPLWTWLLLRASSSLWRRVTASAHRSRRGVRYRALMLQGRVDWRRRLHLASSVVKSSVFHFSSFPVQGQEVGPHISSGLSKKSSREMYSSAMAQHI